MFTAMLVTIVKIWKQPKCSSVDEWIKQLWDIYTMEYYSDTKKCQYIYTMEYYLDIKKEWNLTISNTTDGPRGYYAK